MKKIKRLLAMLLTLILCMGELWTTGITVFATDNEENAGGDSDVPEDAVAEEVLIDKTGTQGTQILIAGKNNYSSDEFTEGYTYLQDGEKLIAHNESGDYVAAEFTYGDEISELKLTNYKAGKEAGLKSADQIYYHGIKYTGNLKIICDGENTISFDPTDKKLNVSPIGIDVDGSLIISNAGDGDAKLAIRQASARFSKTDCVGVSDDLKIENSGNGSISVQITGALFGYLTQEDYNNGTDSGNSDMQGNGLTVGGSLIMQNGSLKAHGGENGRAIDCNNMIMKGGTIVCETNQRTFTKGVSLSINNDLTMFDGEITAYGPYVTPKKGSLYSYAIECKNANISGGTIEGYIQGADVYYQEDKTTACGIHINTISMNGGSIKGETNGVDDYVIDDRKLTTHHTGIYISNPENSSFSGGTIIGIGGKANEIHQDAVGVRLGSSLVLDGTVLQARGSVSAITDKDVSGVSAEKRIQAETIRVSELFDGTSVKSLTETEYDIEQLNKYKYLSAEGKLSKTYTISFDLNGKPGTAPISQVVERGQSVSRPNPDPVAEGYTFIGWFTEVGCINEYDFTTTVTNDFTLYAGWKEKSKYTVIFDMNGMVATDAPAAQQVEEGKTATKPVKDPAADGYTFTGWFADEDGTTEYDFKTVITKNTTIYAGWKEGNDPAKGLTVSFNMMDHGSAIPAQTVSLNGTVEQPDNPSEEGWVFGGWFKEEGCVNEYNFKEPVKENFTLYAKWTEEKESASKGISALDYRPVIDENTMDIYLVIGQKFFIGKEWAVADKVAKQYVSIDKKGYLKAKKLDPESVTVKIKKEGRADITVHICKPALSDKKKTLFIEDADKKTDFTLSIRKDDGIKNVLWYSTAPDVATVDQTGKVTAVAKGKAKITAYVNGKAYNCTITVKESVAAKNRTMHVNLDGSKSIKVKGVKKWTGADETIAEKVNNADKFKAIKVGKTVLSASVNDIKYTIDFYAEDIAVKGDKISNANKNKYTINDLKVGTATDISLPGVKQDVVFKSSKPDVAFIDENGHIEARSKGKARLTTKINGKTITILVVVNE